MTILKCSFCDKNQDEVRILIAGVNGFICDDCTFICVKVVFEKAANNLLIINPKT